MKIVYLAKHDSGGNDDEGAITHALQELGHDVYRIRESQGRNACNATGDFLLFHHWHDSGHLQSVTIPKVFWCFDRIKCGDPTLARRDTNRENWIRDLTRRCDLGFCTDGDWVEEYNGSCFGKTERIGEHRIAVYPEKLVWLTQGADGRFVGRGKNMPLHRERPDILFTGIRRGGGVLRESFVDALSNRYKHRFLHKERGVHGYELANLIARTKIVVAPDFPVTDNYWSNRIYLMCGFGAHLLHPYSLGASRHYTPWTEVQYYENRDHLYSLIEGALRNPEEMHRVASAALERTKAQHLYRHRCEVLVQTVRERLKI